jgi:AcrR family transcriptional regulator
MVTTPVLKEDVIQEQILRAAHQLFQKYGFQKVSVDDVAKAIGKGRSSLYYYYKNKDEIFDAVMDVEIREILTETERAMDRETGIEDKLRAFGINKIKISRKRKSFFDALEAGMNADEISQYARTKLRTHRALIKEETRILLGAFTRAIKEKELPSLEKKELDSVIFIFLCSLRGIKREMMLNDDFSRLDFSIGTLSRMTLGVF